jgi:ubiquinone/menaquinone biosynthesis C-methylase UbiE
VSNLLTDQTYLLTEQYQNAANLNARIQLHARFSANQYGWMPWLFDQLDLPPNCHILELGCGPGDLWLENLARLPEGWEIVLSDFSAGMLHQARSNLGHNQHPFEFALVDAQATPFPGERFDAVIANHMLYHVPDRAKALSEIERVLKPGGRFYASTVGEAHLGEIQALVNRFDPGLTTWGGDAVNPFTLENGMAQLSPWFSSVTARRYQDALEVTEVTPLVEYILSGSVKMTSDQRIEFTRLVEQEMASQGGVIHITKDSGIFEAFRSSA